LDFAKRSKLFLPPLSLSASAPPPAAEGGCRPPPASPAASRGTSAASGPTSPRAVPLLPSPRYPQRALWPPPRHRRGQRSAEPWLPNSRASQYLEESRITLPSLPRSLSAQNLRNTAADRLSSDELEAHRRPAPAALLRPRRPHYQLRLDLAQLADPSSSPNPHRSNLAAVSRAPTAAARRRRPSSDHPLGLPSPPRGAP